LKKYEKWSDSMGVFRTWTIREVQSQLEKPVQAILPLPSLTTQGYQILYIQPAQHRSGKESQDSFVKALVYLMERMTEREKSCSEGIVILANLEGFSWNTFSFKEYSMLANMFVGKFPCRIRKLMIVNDPTAGFNHIIFNLLRPLLSIDLREKIQFLESPSELAELMMGNSYEDRVKSLPIELGGLVDVEKVLQSFIRYRFQVEGLNGEATIAEKKPHRRRKFW
jgi:hypothetical protein